jgi:polyisoprenoid-binding protein YceI
MTTYSVDKAHSEVGFSVRHMVFAKVHGQFKDWESKLTFDAADPSKSSVEVEVAIGSIDTREEKRDGHLRSADFFDAEKFPKMTFKSKRIEAADKGKFKVIGDLALHGETHEVSLDVEETGRGKDPWGNERVGFSAKGSISRAGWGLKYNQALEAGGLLISDKVEIEVEAQVVAGK